MWAMGVVAGWSWPPAPMENDEQLASPNEVGRWTSGGGRVLQPTSDGGGSLFARWSFMTISHVVAIAVTKEAKVGYSM